MAEVNAAYDAITEQPAVPAPLQQDLAAALQQDLDAEAAALIEQEYAGWPGYVRRPTKKHMKQIEQMAAAAKRKAEYAKPVATNEKQAIAEAIAAKLKLSRKLPSHLEILPDPALDPRAFELGKISYAVKVRSDGRLYSFVLENIQNVFCISCDVS